MGSTTVKVAVVDPTGRLLHSRYERHHAKAKETLGEKNQGLLPRPESSVAGLRQRRGRSEHNQPHTVVCRPTKMTKTMTRHTRQENIKDKIIQTAHRLFIRKGFVETSISDIAAAGINRPTLHHYFHTKYKMFRTAFRDIRGICHPRSAGHCVAAGHPCAGTCGQGSGCLFQGLHGSSFAPPVRHQGDAARRGAVAHHRKGTGQRTAVHENHHLPAGRNEAAC